jgi:hypothetical protein
MSDTPRTLTIGKKYRATFEDCCVSGTFEATLVLAVLAIWMTL